MFVYPPEIIFSPTSLNRHALNSFSLCISDIGGTEEKAATANVGLESHYEFFF